MSESKAPSMLAQRFRGYYPVVIDVETAGFNARTDALLEIAAVTLTMDEAGWLKPDQTLFFNVEPFAGANLEKAALEFTGIDPHHPLRAAVNEKDALTPIFKLVREGIKQHGCKRAILVGHNATFDHSFVMAATERAKVKRNPFHPFSTFDTSALAGLIYGQTVLKKACECAGIAFSDREAHSALYDTEITAALFCDMVNRWKRLGGWPPLDIQAGAQNEESSEEKK